MNSVAVTEISARSKQGSLTLYAILGDNYPSLPPFYLVTSVESSADDRYKKWHNEQKDKEDGIKHRPEFYVAPTGEIIISTSNRDRTIRIKRKDGEILSCRIQFAHKASENIGGKILENIQKIKRDYKVSVRIQGHSETYSPEDFIVHYIDRYRRKITLKKHELIET